MDKQLQEILATILELDTELITEDSSVETLESWDSMRHMQIIVAVEETFGIQLSADEIVCGTSFSTLLKSIQYHVHK